MPPLNMQISKSSFDLHLPNPILAAPTKRLRKISESIERFNGRQDLNLRLTNIAIIKSSDAVTQRSPKSSIRKIIKFVKPVNLGRSISAKN